MIRINLLPHREEKRKARRQQFFAVLGLIAVLVVAIWFGGYTIISGYVSAQDGKNAFLKKEAADLDKEIDEIKRLKEQTDQLLSRKRIIESLQADRAETVHLFNELAKQVPEGIYLKTLKQTGQTINLVGYAISNARVSTLMRNLEASPLMEKPDLVEIKAIYLNNRRLSEFNLNVKITRNSTTEESKAATKKDNKPGEDSKAAAFKDKKS